MHNPSLLYYIALSLVPGVGNITAKKLIAYTGNVEGVFKEKKSHLLKIPGIGDFLADQITHQQVLSVAEKEMEFIEKYHISTSCYLDEHYPVRLKNCEDGPVVIFYKGETEFNHGKILSIVGTRNATEYGKECCNQLIYDLKQRGHSIIIVSGLAYGIDICAHRAALKTGFDTIAVLAHGLATIYPGVHKSTANDISKQGALLTDFISSVLPERNNFVKRNRIIAGIADATLVIESGMKGGALITADLANSYNRDVLTIPGRLTDNYSKGCNWLIKSNKAAMVENAEDLEFQLGWEIETKGKATQTELFVEITDEELKIVNILKEHGELPIDIIAIHANLPVSRVSALLLNIEFAGIIRSMPGKIYRLVR